MIPQLTISSLSSLQPVKLRYEYKNDEELNKTSTMYVGGLRIESLQAFNNFQDTVQNRGNCLILTSYTELSSVFKGLTQNQLNIIPGTILIQPNNSTSFFAAKEPLTKRVTISNVPSFIHVRPIPSTSEVEILIDNEYLQVEPNYPFTVYLSEDSFSGADLYRQRFTCTYQGNTCSFSVQTNVGVRYLAYNNDDILRAVGTMLCNSIPNNYIFSVIEVTPKAKSLGFIPKNNIVSYFLSFEDRQNNENVKINQIQEVKTNFLASFSIHEAATTGEVNLNFANLRTNFTPEGVPIPVLPAAPHPAAPPPVLGAGIYASSVSIIGGNSIFDEEGNTIVQEDGDPIIQE